MGWRITVGLLLVNALAAADAGPEAFDAAHPRFDRVLKHHVLEDGRVDYVALKADRSDLDRYLDELAAVPRKTYDAWPEPDRIAFLCNAYNAATLRLVIDHHPVRSIRDIGTLLRGPWDQPVVRLFGGVMTLNHLEHRVLRVEHAEPRIHFALVCAAKGCPPLRREAFVGARLEGQLVAQARAFLAQASKNRVEAPERTVHLSPIFKWYGGDFEAAGGSVLGAIEPYWPEGVDGAAARGYRIRYTDYDWSLNEAAR